MVAHGDNHAFASGKAVGFDPKTMKKIVALRKMDDHERLEADALLTTYMHGVGMAEIRGIEKLRFGVAFGGVAYTLAAAERLGLNGEIPIDEVRTALLTILHDLLVPADTLTA